MSCSPFDLRDYHFRELADPQRRQVESHVKTCEACREELERLQLTESALFTLREEEIPQRIAFVSDPVFEPSPLRRWISDFWGSAARLSFASAAMLSAALVVFALHRPAPAPVIEHVPVAVNTVAQQPDVQKLVDAAVAKAVAEAEERQVAKTSVLVADLEKAHQQLRFAAYDLERTQKAAAARVAVAMNYGPPNENGELR
jgi:hypothetical protein